MIFKCFSGKGHFKGEARQMAWFVGMEPTLLERINYSEAPFCAVSFFWSDVDRSTGIWGGAFWFGISPMGWCLFGILFLSVV
ncbi:hypothetical protein CCP4SC76_6350002 [Gammaproteobacteria bacterium]